MQLTRESLLAFLSILRISLCLKCLAGNNQYSRPCESQSYCVSIRSKTGLVQRSCDGNSIGQISLCLMTTSNRKQLLSNSHDYAGYSSSDYGSAMGKNSPKQTGKWIPTVSLAVQQQSPRSLRAQIDNNCFNGGELGIICCCSTDYCNSSPLQKSSLTVIWFSIFFIFVGISML